MVRPGDENEELRYSLRSVAAHVPHDRVWIAGHMPSWVTGVGHIPTEQSSTKWANSTGNVRAACEHPDVSERFLLFNDDIFVMQPLPGGVPVLNRGPLDEVINQHGDRRWSRYVLGMEATRTRLAAHGYSNVLSFELHVPLPVEKTLMLKALDLGAGIRVWHKRTAYGAVAGLVGETVEDVKIHGRRELPPEDATFVSTNDRSFREGRVGRWIRDRHATACSYENTDR